MVLRPGLLCEAFNAHMQLKVNAGWLLACDESMIAWRGKQGLRDPSKCPHRSFVRRKPEPVGVELKNIGDAISGLILNQEMVEGKAENLR